jgi:excisionase family DNA binding protein
VAKEDAAPKSDVPPRFLTLDDVAAYLAVSVPQAYALVCSGDLPAIKIGGRGVWRVDKAQLETYVDNLSEETSKWTKSHPLSSKDKGEAG